MSDELVRLLRGLRRAKALNEEEGPKDILLAPGSTFEAVLQERLRTLEAELAEVRGRVNGLLFVVLGAVLVQLLLRLLS